MEHWSGSYWSRSERLTISSSYCLPVLVFSSVSHTCVLKLAFYVFCMRSCIFSDVGSFRACQYCIILSAWTAECGLLIGQLFMKTAGCQRTGIFAIR